MLAVLAVYAAVFGATDPLVVSIVAVVVASVLGIFFTFLAWMARELFRSSRALDRVDERTINHEGRITKLEGE